MIYIGFVVSFLLGVFAVFHVLLFLGFPYGHASWGGRQSKILPKSYRLASAFSSLFFFFSIAVVLSKTTPLELFPDSFATAFVWFLTVYMGIGIIMNAISPSKVERRWVPVVTLIFIFCLVLQLRAL